MYPKDLIKKLQQSLPSEISSIIASEETLAAVESLGSKFTLSYDQYKTLGLEVSTLLLGLTPPDKFVAKLTEKLGTTPDISTQIASEVTAQIISKIPEKFLQAQEEYAQARLKEIPAVNAPGVIPDILPETLPNQPVRVVPHVEAPKVAAPAPQNLPTSPSDDAKRPDLSFPSSQYPKGTDPYREPLN